MKKSPGLVGEVRIVESWVHDYRVPLERFFVSRGLADWRDVTADHVREYRRWARRKFGKDGESSRVSALRVLLRSVVRNEPARGELAVFLRRQRRWTAKRSALAGAPSDVPSCWVRYLEPFGRLFRAMGLKAWQEVRARHVRAFLSLSESRYKTPTIRARIGALRAILRLAELGDGHDVGWFLAGQPDPAPNAAA